MSSLRALRCMGESHVCRLKNTLYGMKQAQHAWYVKIDGHLLGLGFIESKADSELYYILVEGERLILVHYVDDLFLTGPKKLIGMCKKDLTSEFEKKDIDLMHCFLGSAV